MKAMNRAAWILVLFLGCGGNSGDYDPGPPTPVVHRYADDAQGNWLANLNAVCAVGVNFAGAAFSWNIVCSEGGAIELASDQGTFTADALKIYVTISKSTCADAQKTYFLPYTVAPGSLTISTAEEVILFARNTSTGGTGVARFGCFRDGVFTPSPLAPI